MIRSILPVQITSLAIVLHNLSPCPLWSGALHLTFHTFRLTMEAQKKRLLEEMMTFLKRSEKLTLKCSIKMTRQYVMMNFLVR